MVRGTLSRSVLDKVARYPKVRPREISLYRNCCIGAKRARSETFVLIFLTGGERLFVSCINPRAESNRIEETALGDMG